MPSYPAALVANSLLAPSSAAAAAAAAITSSAFSSDRDYKQVQARNQGPRLLSQDVPACALSCLEKFISSDKAWDRCPEPLDANCLCKERSKEGFTVAEAGLRCVAENCPDSEADQHRVYNLCSGVDGALPNTHPVLGIPSTAGPKPTVTSSPAPPMASTTAMAPGQPAPTPPAPAPAPPASETLPSMSMIPTEPTMPSPMAPGEVTNSPSPTSTRAGIPGVGLPTDSIDFSYVYTSPTETGTSVASAEAGGGGPSGQLIGLYVGGGVAFVSLIAFVLFFFYLHKRRQRSKQGHMGGKGQSGPYLKIDRAMTESRATPALSSSKASSKPRSTTSRHRALLPIDMMPCSVAYLHRSTRDLENEYQSSRGQSLVSQRTESDLLPDNPYCPNNGGSRGVPKDHSPGMGYGAAMPFGDGSGNRGPMKGSLHRDVSQAVVDPLRSASSLNYSPALVQANHRPANHSPHSFSSGSGYATHSPNLSQQKSSPDPRYLAVPSKAHSSLGRNHGSTRDQVSNHPAAPSFGLPEPLTSRSINSYQSHIPRQLSPVREVPSTGPPSSAGSPEPPHPAYHPGHISYFTESDGASEVSIRTYSKLVPPPLSTQNSILASYLTEALPDHSPTLPKSMHGSISSCYSSPRSSAEHVRLTHQYSSRSNHKPSNLLVKRRGEKVAGKMGDEFTLPAKLQRPIEIEHDQIHDDDDDSTTSTTTRSSSVPQPHYMHDNTAEATSPPARGHRVTPSKRGADMYLNID
ncbi:hypothetical protein FQN49_002241 [Arthroderma sp. PD_2]|nr:hypothetical protein FQN49_002241 [Arthroderma sp. PD_2]